MKIFDDKDTVLLECTKCGTNLSFTFKEIKNEEIVQCPKCKANIQFRYDRFSKNIGKTQKVLDDVMDALNNFSKK